MNEEAGDNQDRDGETQQAKDGKKRRDGFGDDCENCHGTVDRQFDWAEMLQIESDAHPLGPGGKDRSHRFPAHQHGSGDDGVLEEQAESEKHGAIADARESRHQEIGAQLAEAGSVKNVRSSRGTQAAICEVEASEHRRFEQRNGNGCAGKKFTNDQDLFPYGNQKLIVESALDHFAAEKPGKNPHAGEKDAKPKIVKLHNSSEDQGVFLKLRRAGSLVQKVVDEKDDDGYQSEQVNPNPAPRKQVSANFIAHEDGDLAGK